MTGAEVVAARAQLGLTPTELARLIGYRSAKPGRIVSRWERDGVSDAAVVFVLRALLEGYRPGAAAC